LRISLVLSDGQKLIALRYSSDQRSPSVHLGQGGEALAEAELKDVGDGPNVLVLSEPLDDVSGSWRKVEESSIVIAHQGGISAHSFAPERWGFAGTFKSAAMRTGMVK
jgi:predicted glutamine amidotransferase